MSAVVAVGLLVVVSVFLGWVLYDCGFDSGYSKAWNEAHPPRSTDTETK